MTGPDRTEPGPSRPGRSQPARTGRGDLRVHRADDLRVEHGDAPSGGVRPGPGVDDRWAGYAEALGRLHRARDDAFQTFRAGQLADAERAARIDRLGSHLADQRGAIDDLATRLRAPGGSVDLTPSAVPPLDGDAALADLEARTADADRAIADTRRAAILPQLLPDWRSQFARAAVVYAGFGIPSLLLTVMLSLAGVTGNNTVLAFFAVIWPAVTALGGGSVVRHVSRPRAGDDATFRQERFDAATTFEQKTRVVLGRLGRREPLYRWFGVLVAWASWLVPGWILDQFASAWPG